MKNEWPLKIILALSLLIPLAFSPNTFDHFGTVKLVIWLFGLGILALFSLVNLNSFFKLPKNLLLALGFFISMQAFQTFRLRDIGMGIFGAYGQSESFLVQLSFIVIFLASYAFMSNESAREKFKKTIIITVCLSCIYGIFQYFFVDPIIRHSIVRITSLFGDPNSFGIFLILTLPLVLEELKKTYRQPGGYFSGSCLFLGVTVLFLTFSRASWLSFVISLVFLMLGLMVHKKAAWKEKLVFATLVLAIISGGVIFGQTLTFFQPVGHSDYTLPARIASVSRGNDSGRGLIWSPAWKAFKSSPLIGYGIGSFQTSFHRYESVKAATQWRPERDIRQVHNETLHYLATQGILGLSSYLWLLLALFFAGNILNLFKREIPFEELTLWTGIVAYLISMQFAYPLVHYSFLCWIYFGLLVGYHNPPPKLTTFTLCSQRVLILSGVLLTILWGFLNFNIYQADVFYRKAFITAHKNDYVQSFANYHRAIALNPWSYYYRYRYAAISVQAAYWEKEKALNPHLENKYLNQAKSNLLCLNKMQPNDYKLYFLLGKIAEEQGNFYKAKNYYLRALTLFPNNYEIDFRLAKVELLLGNRGEFSRIFQVGSQINAAYMQEMLSREGLSLSGSILKTKP